MTVKRLGQNTAMKFFFFALVIAGHTYSAWGIEPEALLRSSLEAQFQLDLEGIKKVQLHTKNQDHIFTAHLLRLGPDFSYLLYLSPSRVEGRMIVDDGGSRKEYTPRKRELKLYPSIRSRVMEKQRRQNLELLVANYEIVRKSDEIVVGRPSYRICLVPRYAGNPRLDIWIEKGTYLLLKKKRYNAEGALVVSSSFIPSAGRKGAHRESVYRSIRGILGEGRPLVIPIFQGLEEIEQIVRFALRVPRYLPSGYVFQGATLTDKAGTVKMTYANGLGVVCFFQRPRARIEMKDSRRVRFTGLQGRLREREDQKSLVWDKAGMTFILMGDLSEEELGKMAVSVK